MRIVEKCRQHLLPPQERTPPEKRIAGCGNCYECTPDWKNWMCNGKDMIRETYDENSPEVFLG